MEKNIRSAATALRLKSEEYNKSTMSNDSDASLLIQELFTQQSALESHIIELENSVLELPKRAITVSKWPYKPHAIGPWTEFSVCVGYGLH